MTLPRISSMGIGKGPVQPAAADTVLSPYDLSGPAITINELLIYEDGSVVEVRHVDIPDAEKTS